MAQSPSAVHHNIMLVLPRGSYFGSDVGHHVATDNNTRSEFRGVDYPSLGSSGASGSISPSETPSSSMEFSISRRHHKRH